MSQTWWEHNAQIRSGVMSLLSVGKTSLKAQYTLFISRLSAEKVFTKDAVTILNMDLFIYFGYCVIVYLFMYYLFIYSSFMDVSHNHMEFI